MRNAVTLHRPAPAERSGPGAGAIAAGILAGTAAALGATALYVNWRAREAEREEPPVGSFVEVDGLRLHYLERGRGQPIVLLHGASMMLQDWTTSGLVDRLAGDHRTIAFDRPGYGYSDRPKDRTWTPLRQAMVIAKALRRLDVEQPLIVGHSFSALVALAYGLAYPQETGGLVCMSGYLYPTPRPDFALYSVGAQPVIGPIYRNTASPIIGQLFAHDIYAAFFAPNEMPRRFAEEFPFDLAVRPGQIRAASEDFAALRQSARHMAKRYDQLKVPCAVLAGASDPIADPKAHSARLHEAIPGSTLRLVPETGHMLHHIHPEAVLTAVGEVESRAQR